MYLKTVAVQINFWRYLLTYSFRNNILTGLDIQDIVLVKINRKKKIAGKRYSTNVRDTTGCLYKKYM